MTSEKAAFLCPKVDLSLQDIVYVCCPHMFPGNGCNGCFTEMCAKAQNHFKAQLLFEVVSQEWSACQNLK